MKTHLKKIIVFAANAALVLAGVVLIENYENNKNNIGENISQNQNNPFVQENALPANNNIATQVIPNNTPTGNNLPSSNSAIQQRRTSPRTRTS